MFTLSLKRALTALVAMSTLTDARPPCPPRDNQEWVTVWGAMPQLTEPQTCRPPHSIYLAAGQTTNAITSHPGSRTSSWLAHGNHVSDAELPSPVRTDHWFLISALEARLYKGASTFAIVGDSLTDGRGSTTNANNRWPDRLLARLQLDPATSQVAILNQAAGGNRVLNDGLGPAALGRIDRDVLAHSGVRYALLFIGINDIGTTASRGGPDPHGRPPRAGLRPDGVPHPPKGHHRLGRHADAHDGRGSGVRDARARGRAPGVNAWIRTSGVFDAVVDFDEMVRDPSAPDQLAAAYDEGDHLHLNPAGYQAMADGFDLALLAAASAVRVKVRTKVCIRFDSCTSYAHVLSLRTAVAMMRSAPLYHYVAEPLA
ncbi:lipolytic enzyme [Verticillium alfalfae VaMs.102]|uniref:Lipolytic enzyme n=1 Tax=Verticillium alfalfae (strain VaMs.102 / ATCC MYA-4576 / FGSC 10136) TaxID=526221 RepID=C9SHN7_VERA1|nr:lipolytic enzyme [Verticillium alfalfae VaMs.102]EEY18460.1 lipolytic enzyme [Verticillium alfalfae VaMs.102]